MLSRNSSSVISLRPEPSTAKLSDNKPSQARLYKAGTSKRLVKSPDAPKITITQGSLGALSPCDSIPIEPMTCELSDIPLPSPF